MSIISEGYYMDHLQHLPLEPIGDILDIECAGGDVLPYKGFVRADLSTFGGGNDQDSVTCLFLVVPITRYSVRVPVLLGTNILNCLLDKCKNIHGVRFLQKAPLHTPWYLTFRTIVIEAKELERNNWRLGLVKSAEDKNIIIPSNGRVTIKGQLSKGLRSPRYTALLHPTPQATIPPEVDIAPTIITYDRENPNNIEVHVFNITTRTIVVPPRSLLCELQPVALQDAPVGHPLDETSLLDQVEIDEEDLTPEEIEQGHDVILKFKDIFSKHDEDLGHSSAVKHRIELVDEQPFKQRYRHIPPGMFEEVRTHLQQLLSAGVILNSHSPLASNVVLARKKDGKLKFVLIIDS